MCRATVGELYVPESQTEPGSEPNLRDTRVQIENFAARQRTEYCQNRGTQISCVACLLAFIVLIIVIIRIMMGN